MSAVTVTVTPTIMDGTVVRWLEHAEDHARPLISASRNGVIGTHAYITPELFDAAWATHLALKSGQDVSHLATHRRRSLTGPYEPIDALQARPAEPQSGARP